MNMPATLQSQVRFADVKIAPGVRLHYAEFGNPAGEPILFLHGFTDSWLSFSPVLPYINPNYHVWMIDQRGHGNSSRPIIRYAIDHFADDVIAFMDAVGLDRVTLVGHSMGSLIAQRTAFNAPQRIKRMVLIGTTAQPYTDELGNFLDTINELVDPVPEELAREFQISTIYRTLAPEFMEQVVAETLKLPAFVWRATLGEMLFNGTTPSVGIHAPTLILWGDQDVIWPRSQQELLVDSLPAGELFVYPETGHVLHWEQPARFAVDLEAFITRTALL